MEQIGASSRSDYYIRRSHFIPSAQPAANPAQATSSLPASNQPARVAHSTGAYWAPGAQSCALTTQTGYGTTPSGCRGGSRYFEGVRGFLETQRFKKLIVHKYQDSTRIKNYLEIPKIRKIDRPKIPRFHADPKLLGNPKDSTKWSSKNTKIPRGFKIMENGQYVFKNMFDLVGFTYVLKICGSQRFIKIPPS